MTAPRIDAKLLEEIHQEMKDEKAQQELREWMVYGAPLEVQQLWGRYVEKMQAAELRKEQQRDEFLEGQANAAKWAGFFVFLACIAVVIWCAVNTYEIVTAGCLR